MTIEKFLVITFFLSALVVQTNLSFCSKNKIKNEFLKIKLKLFFTQKIKHKK